jgi:hypothetical protein
MGQPAGPGQTKQSYRQAKKIEAELLEQVDRGQHRGSSSRTVAELIERWLSWRQQVRPISPVTVANYRGAIDRYIRPAYRPIGLTGSGSGETSPTYLRWSARRGNGRAESPARPGPGRRRQLVGDLGVWRGRLRRRGDGGGRRCASRVAARQLL